MGGKVSATASTTLRISVSTVFELVGPATSVEVTDAVFEIVPASASTCVTTCVPVNTQVAPGATDAQFSVSGDNKPSVTTTFVSGMLPVFVTVTVYVNVSPSVISVELSASVVSVGGSLLTIVKSGIGVMTLTVSVKSSPVVVLSYCSLVAAVVVFVIALPSWPALTVPSNVRVALAPAASVPISHVVPS